MWIHYTHKKFKSVVLVENPVETLILMIFQKIQIRFRSGMIKDLPYTNQIFSIDCIIWVHKTKSVSKYILIIRIRMKENTRKDLRPLWCLNPYDFKVSTQSKSTKTEEGISWKELIVEFQSPLLECRHFF